MQTKYEGKRRFTRQLKFLLFLLVLLSSQCVISTIQYLRYDYNDYCCVQMSRDCEYFFESIGIRVWQVSGEHYDAHGLADAGHEWILLDFHYFAIPFESTLLLPGIDPAWRGYKDLEISPGFIDTNGTHIDNPSWSDWV